MEEYVLAQARDGTYDLFANLAILKLSAALVCLASEADECRYQFNPHMSNPEIIVHVLIEALSGTVHGPDFNLCLSVLRDPVVSFM